MRVAMLVGTVMFWPAGAVAGAVSTPHWERVSAGEDESAFVTAATDPGHTAAVYAATGRALYESDDDGRTWRERFRAPGPAVITDVAVASSAGSSSLLVGTNHGLYGSLGQDDPWLRVFSGAGAGEAFCTRVAFHPTVAGQVVVATRGGVFLSADHGRHWQELGIPQAARDVVDIGFDPKEPDRLYLLARNRVLAGSLMGDAWQALAGMLDAEETEVEQPEPHEASEAEEENGSLHRLSAIAVDPQQPATIYLGSTRGLDRSRDSGVNWERLSRLGLAPAPISHLLLQAHSPVVVYAATDNGVLRYTPSQGRWMVIGPGLESVRVHRLAAQDGVMWAATEHGLYRYRIGPDPFAASGGPPPAHELLANFAHEPTIAQAREAAIRYAEVHPEKIRRWRKQAALQALLPTLSFGMDRDRARDVHVDEGSFPNFQLLETQDRDTGLDLNISWDLGELIWNDDQTAIDVRSKLMVQLRDDIVDEVTRTYFERRRLQVTLLTNPPAEEQALLEKELRLQELTALLDGLTGGEFSARIKVPGER